MSLPIHNAEHQLQVLCDPRAPASEQFFGHASAAERAVLLSGKIENVKRRLYILADGWDPSPFRYFAKKYTGAPGWDVIKLPSGHDVMVGLPNELAAAIAKIA